MTPLYQILELARWAPSGDNSQPWRFAAYEPDRVIIFARDTRDHCVYDLDGRASQISVGALLETVELAATRFGLCAAVQRMDRNVDDQNQTFEVAFRVRSGTTEHPLVRYIEQRRVHRGRLSMRPLSRDEKQILNDAVGPNIRIRWFEGWRERLRVTRINFDNAKLRLTLPEAYPIHRDVIEWNSRYSEDRIPDAALGASRPTLSMMRWGLASWARVAMLNRYFAGTLPPRIELDLLPGTACAAHCFLVATKPPAGLDDYLAAGHALQRFWLQATALGLQFQPSYTPLVFARYAREHRRFTARSTLVGRAEGVRRRLLDLLGGHDEERAMFLGRIGAGCPADARSVRLPLTRLLQ